ncbi:MAG: hypothetical protein JNJ80_05125 [Gemmatimonadetes bacterium]|nr:hypothetical protein [Gemmatimonadota bacterium]
MKTTLAFLCALVGLGSPAAAQVSFSRDAIEELQSISIRVDVQGPADEGRVGGRLAQIVRQELTRADILWERGDPRGDDCCVLRVDVRLATGAGRARFGVGYTMRLELGYPDRLGNVPAWTVIWAGRMTSNIVERNDLDTLLEAGVRELTGEFIDLYRERFPRR